MKWTVRVKAENAGFYKESHQFNNIYTDKAGGFFRVDKFSAFSQKLPYKNDRMLSFTLLMT